MLFLNPAGDIDAPAIEIDNYQTKELTFILDDYIRGYTIINNELSISLHYNHRKIFLCIGYTYWLCQSIYFS